MIDRKCKSCGAPLKSIGWGKYICEYCGTLHEDDSFGRINVITVVQKPAQTITAQCTIPDEMRRIMEPEDLGKYTLRELSESLADGIAGLMKIRVSDDPMYCRTLVRGEVQVIPPDHRLDLGAELRHGKGV